MKNRRYWEKRFENIAASGHIKADQYTEILAREYDKAYYSIQKDINNFYQRYATNNQITLSEARKLLGDSELKEFKMSIEEFIKNAKNNPDGLWTKELNNVYYRVRVSRLEALQIQMKHHIQTINMNQNTGMASLLGGIYQDTYYKTIFEVQKGLNFGVSFAKVDTKTIERILKTPWLETNYSQRIWTDNAKLTRYLQTELTQAIIRGDDHTKTARIIAERMGVGKRNAERLVRTEASHIQNEASFDAYRAGGVVQKYEYLATLDTKTSEICKALDGKTFTLAEKQVGVNFPPLHPNCRSTTVPYFDDDEISERIARSGKKIYYVPSDINYREWQKKYVA